MTGACSAIGLVGTLARRSDPASVALALAAPERSASDAAVIRFEAAA